MKAFVRFAAPGLSGLLSLSSIQQASADPPFYSPKADARKLINYVRKNGKADDSRFPNSFDLRIDNKVWLTVHSYCKKGSRFGSWDELTVVDGNREPYHIKIGGSQFLQCQEKPDPQYPLPQDGIMDLHEDTEPHHAVCGGLVPALENCPETRRIAKKILTDLLEKLKLPYSK